MDRSEIKGLSAADVEARLEAGLFNDVSLSRTKSISQIIKENLFTFFNILNLVFALMIICTGRLANLSFLIVVVFNLVIGLVQEISAKKTLDKLSFINSIKVKTIRDNKAKYIPINMIVKDDVLIFTSGSEVCADCVILSGQCEVNESAISGENDLLLKKEADNLVSGSFVVSGTVYVKVIAVGTDSIAGTVALNASEIRVPNSSLMNSINAILKTLSIIIIPFGVLVFFKGMILSGLCLADNINSTIALLISMVPEGLVLMTSLALVSCSVILSKKRIIIQNLFAVESLARTDVLCMDKTGTITTGDMIVSHYQEIIDIKQEIKFAILQLGDCNPTFIAIKKYFLQNNNEENSMFECLWSVDFKSENKFSCVSIYGFGRIFIGAPDVLIQDDEFKKVVDYYHINVIGKRMIVIAYDRYFENKDIYSHNSLKCVAIISIEETIKKDADKTVCFFKNQGIEPVIITGDSYESIYTIIKNINIVPNCSEKFETFDVNNLSDYNIFCRTVPENKKQIVEAFQKTGNNVAMVGDGVNDVLALKKANSSIAMGSGSDISRNISDIVLLDSDIGVMPIVFNHGRRVINNIQRVASLFLSKTIYSFIIAILILCVPNMLYPFNALQLTFLSFITIGLPSFFLSFEPDYSKVKGNFIHNVLIKSLPGAFAVVISFILINVFASHFNINYCELNTMSFVAFSIIGIINMLMISWPLTKLRLYVLLATVAILLCYILIPVMRDLLNICDLSFETVLVEIFVCIFSTVVLLLIRKYIHNVSAIVFRLFKIRLFNRIIKH